MYPTSKSRNNWKFNSYLTANLITLNYCWCAMYMYSYSTLWFKNLHVGYTLFTIVPYNFSKMCEKK